MKHVLIVLFIGFIFNSFAQKVHYTLSMPEPQTHYFHVDLELSDFSEETVVVSLPTWAPGSYLIREFSKNIDVVTAKDAQGKVLPIEKISKNKWSIKKGSAEKVTVSYDYYAFELTVRTSFLDLTHGYLNGSNVFVYVDGYKNLSGTLTVIPFEGFEHITTALPISNDGITSDDKRETFTFRDFDHLADSPIEIGNQEIFSFDAAGVKHTVAIYGPGNYDKNQLKIDMAKIVEAATDIFGSNPNKEYVFIIHNTNFGSGGLEHLESTTLNVNRWTYQGSDYMGFLSLVAHEYFHLWLVKRLRPKALGPFDYDQENYTDLLWVMEGFTSYYDELILRRAGFYEEEQYVGKLISTLNYVEGSIGNKVQPVAHSSFDAWIKAYRPNENSSNTTISYYSKGHLVCAVLDAMMIEKYKGKKGMDDFLQILYKKYYEKEKRGFTSEEFEQEISDFVGRDLTTFFEKHIYGTETVEYEKYFSPLGVELVKTEGMVQGFGVSTRMDNGRLIVRSVSRGSMAEKAGVSPNDEIIAFNGFRVDQSSFMDFMDYLEVGDEFVLIISRDEQLMVIDAAMGMQDAVRYSFSFEEDNALQKYWLRTKTY